MPLTLAQAVLKGDKMDDVVRDATMMGVAAIEPIVTAHTDRAHRTRAAAAPSAGAGGGLVREAVPPRGGAGDRAEHGRIPNGWRRRRQACG